MAKQTYYNTRNKLIRDGKIKKEEIGRQLWLYLPEDEELFREIAGWGFKKEETKFYLTVKEIDETIAKIIKNKGKIPTIEKIGIEVGKDPKNNTIHSQIYERLAIVQRQQNAINEVISKIFYEKVKAFGITREYEEEECIPIVEEIIERLQWGESERSNPALGALLDLCLNNFKAAQSKLV